jgi:hypothetical protein
VVIADADGLSARDRSGAELWRVPLDHRPTALGASVNGTVHVGLGDGRVVDISGGEVIGVRLTGTAAVTTVVVDENAGAVYALSARGEVFATTPVSRRVSGDAKEVAGVVARSAGGVFMLMSSGEIRELASTDAKASQVVPAPGVVGGRRHRATFAIGPKGRAVVAGPGWTVAGVRVGSPGAGWSHARGAAHGRAAVGTRASTPGRSSSDEIDRIYLSRMLSSGEVADRRRALNDISARLDGDGLAGSYGRVVEALLAFVSGSGGGRTPAERNRAIRILARIGDYGVRDTLLSIAGSSRDRSLRIAVLESIEYMPVDEKGRTARLIHRVVRQEARAGADRRLGRAGIDAVEAYVSYRGSVDHPELGAAIGVLATGGFPPEIRRQVAGLAAELY